MYIYIYIFTYLFICNRRKFRSQTSDNMNRWKAEMGRVREEKRREEERRSKKRKSQTKEDTGARKGRKVAKHCVFPMICGSGGSKSSSLKRRVRSQLARWEMKDCTPLWRETHLQVKKLKTLHIRSRKSVHHCGAKHISKSKCTKHTMFGPLLEVEMSKKCTSLWREAKSKV